MHKPQSAPTLVTRARALAVALAVITSPLPAGCAEEEPGCVPEAAAAQPLSGAYLDQARALADSWIKRHGAAGLKWNWEEAVLLNGVLALYDATGEARYLDYARTYVEHHLKAGYALNTSDTVAPAAAAAELYRRTCDLRYRSVIYEVYDYLTIKAPRTKEGGINHLGPLMKSIPQLWIDSLYMFGQPMLRGGRYTREPAMEQLVADQLEIFSKVLQDDGDGLYRHASINGTLVPDDDTYWARGNSWALITGAELLGDGAGSYPGLRARFDRQAAAILGQQVAGQDLWYTVLSAKPTYIETAGSALIVAGLARGLRRGLIDPTKRALVDRAAAALLKTIVTRSGALTVAGTSVGTMPGSFAYYANVPQQDDVPYGVGAVLLALVEIQRLAASQ